MICHQCGSQYQLHKRGRPVKNPTLCPKCRQSAYFKKYYYDKLRVRKCKYTEDIIKICPESGEAFVIPVFAHNHHQIYASEKYAARVRRRRRYRQNPAMREKNRARKMKQYYDHKKKGLCVYCKNENNGISVMCEKHYQAMRVHNL